MPKREVNAQDATQGGPPFRLAGRRKDRVARPHTRFRPPRGDVLVEAHHEQTQPHIGRDQARAGNERARYGMVWEVKRAAGREIGLVCVSFLRGPRHHLALLQGPRNNPASLGPPSPPPRWPHQAVAQGAPPQSTLGSGDVFMSGFVLLQHEVETGELLELCAPRHFADRSRSAG